MRNGLEQLKLETAAELGILNYDQIDKGELSARINGKIGGLMVQKMIRLAKQMLAEQYQFENMETEVLTLDYDIAENNQVMVQRAFPRLEVLQDDLIPAYQVDNTSEIYSRLRAV